MFKKFAAHTLLLNSISTVLQTLVKKRLVGSVLPGDCHNPLLLSSKANPWTPGPLCYVHAQHSTGLKEHLLPTFYENIKRHGFVFKRKTTPDLSTLQLPRKAFPAQLCGTLIHRQGQLDAFKQSGKHPSAFLGISLCLCTALALLWLWPA